MTQPHKTYNLIKYNVRDYVYKGIKHLLFV